METAINDVFFMRKALELAERAYAEDEIPVGAIVVAENQIIGKGYNQTEKLMDVTAHAEMIALTAAFASLNSKYLKECTLYVTLEPCVMCAGALFWSQISRVVFGAFDTKRGYSRQGLNLLHPATKVEGGVLEEQCSQLLKQFFGEKRG